MTPQAHPGSAAHQGATDHRALAAALLDRALWLYGRMAQARSVHMNHDEQGLTKDLLIDLKLALPDLRVLEFSRTEEAVNGADWEWWLEGRRMWFGMRVQAKALKSNGGSRSYDVNKTIKRADGTVELQVDALCRQAGADRVPAIYVLYNSPDLPDPMLPWNCASHPASRERFGIAFIPASRVRHIQHKKRGPRTTLSALAPFALPWSCLAECPLGSMGVWPRSWSRISSTSPQLSRALGLIDVKNPGVGDIVARMVAHSLAAGTGGLILGQQQDPSEPVGDLAAETSASEWQSGVRVTGELPNYVRRVLAGATDVDDEPPVRQVAVLPARGATEG